ncbi:hypothetical protein DIC66_21555 [Rhodoferax lacus]|uniref:Uncharacterized protein n=1 Tax=Rhodoferax lacus TaxID=2184758 RepID=A0A3E1R6J8_9BURK|nr:hypothetical protein [Rhodoferax lacus]RFO94801.1 hypothetical protein DIC66_21555 [Rhodoferax lacus]
MSKPIFERAFVITQRKYVNMFGNANLESINQVFNFRVEDLPLRPRQELPPQYGEPTFGLTFDLASGHTISMTKMVQFSSQDGMLEGVKHPLSSFGDAIDQAKVAFPSFEGAPTGLAPVLECSLDSASEDESWIAVPPICTVAIFESMAPAKDPEADTSTAVLIWFQDGFGLALDNRTKQQI